MCVRVAPRWDAVGTPVVVRHRMVQVWGLGRGREVGGEVYGAGLGGSEVGEVGYVGVWCGRQWYGAMRVRTSEVRYISVLIMIEMKSRQ